MIVVDTHLLAYLYLSTELTPQAEPLLVKEPDWAAPMLWRSELRNVLALYLRRELLTLEQACAMQAEAEYDVPSLDVLRLVQSSDCSAYDCEFVALAKRLNVKLVTADKKIPKEFPGVAVTMAEALG